MKQLLLILLVLAGTIPTSAQISVTATAGTTGPTAYTTLKGAFDAVNAGTHRGVITVSVTNNTTETLTATLNASGSGSATYTSVSISPSGGAARTISGNIGAALISLNGADNVTIDGLNAGGNSLVIENTNTTSSATSISIGNDGCSNIITKCTIKGSGTGTGTAGTVYLGTGSTTGNDNNTISYCNIGPSGANLPYYAIYSKGTDNKGNGSNTVSNCNIYDYFNGAAGGTDAGIYLYGNGTYNAGVYAGYANNTAWTIRNNSFYQTGTRTKGSGSSVTYCLFVNAGDGHTITGNYFGGSSANCTGRMTYTGACSSFQVLAFSNYNDITNTCTIDGNYFSNIDFTTSTTSSQSNFYSTRFSVLFLMKGKFNFTNNVIGSGSETGSITFNQTGAANTMGAIFQADNDATYQCLFGNVNNNTIGGISITNSAASYFNYQIIYLYFIDALDSFSNNIIGSTSTANSITWAGYNNDIIVNWINKYSGTYNSSWQNNTVQNLAFNTTNNSAAIIGLCISSNFITNLTSCTVKNITNAATGGDLVGIIDYSTTAGRSFTGNTVSDLSGGANVYGIKSTNSAPTIEKNFVRNLISSNAASTVYGIYTGYNSTGGTIRNNIIRLGNSSATNPVYKAINVEYGANVYFNTVYLSGTASGGTTASYGFYRSINSGTLNVRNNIFYNARTNSGGTGTHYAVYLAGNTSTTINYNDYYAPGTGGVLGKFNSTNKTTLADWKAATGQDVNSMNTDALFANAGGTLPTDYIPFASLPAVTGTGVTTDYLEVTRNSSTPSMGAIEYSKLWTGLADGDWNNASNWTPGIPASTDIITFSATAANDLTLDQSRALGGINFNGSGRKVILGNFNLTTGSCFNSNSQSYLKTNGTGRIFSTISNGGSFAFPSGNSAYNPVTITNNTGASDEFSVGLTDEVYLNGSDGSTVPNSHVTRTWQIGKTNSNGGSGINLQFQWNAGEDNGIVTPYLYHFDGSHWVKQSGTSSNTSTSFSYSGYTGSFSPFAIADESFNLPATGMQLTGILADNEVTLKWKTLTEQNTAWFNVQYSQDGVSWLPVTVLPAAGTSDQVITYSAKHKNILQGLWYYRVAITDIDGYTRFSNVITIRNTFKPGHVFAYPNPTNGLITISVPEGISDNAQLMVSDMSGRQLYTTKGFSNSVINADISQLPKGIYLFTISDTTNKMQLLVNKQ